MPDAESIALSLDELRAVVSAVEEHLPASAAASKVTLERYDAVVIAKWAWRPGDAGAGEGGHGGGPVEVVIYRGEKVAERVHDALRRGT